MGIDIKDLCVNYGGMDVIAGLDLAIPEGCFFTLLGPSGCGKTTLLRTIAGFVQASRGTIRFQSRDVTRLPPYKRNIGMVFQDYALFPDKTVAENVAYGLRARGESGEAMMKKVRHELEHVGLGHLMDRHPAALSGGQRQRVALARAMVIKPQVLLMDEPLSNLDAKLRIQIRETIADLQREASITTVFVTHDQEEALSMSDRIGVMNRGAVEQIGTPKEIYSTPRTSYVADFVGAANRIDVRIADANCAGMARVELGGAAILARNGLPAAMREGILIIRPEDLRLGPAVSADPQALRGRVVKRQYLGGKTSYKLALRDDTVLSVESHGDNHDGFEIGAEVVATVDPSKAVVIAS